MTPIDHARSGTSGGPWPGDTGVKCVVLCAGKGERLHPALGDLPKVLVPIKGTPILSIVVDYWSAFTRDFVFVVGYQKEQVISFAQQLPVAAEFVEQTELRGIGHAVSLTEPLVRDRFIVVLGDCLCKGTFRFPDGMEQGVGVQRTDNKAQISMNFMVDVEGDRVCAAVEKPPHPTTDLCGLGFYFLGRQVFEHIQSTPPSRLRGEVEITDVIQHMIDAGEAISPVMLSGHYVNMTFPEDIARAAALV